MRKRKDVAWPLLGVKSHDGKLMSVHQLTSRRDAVMNAWLYSGSVIPVLVTEISPPKPKRRGRK